MLGVYADGGFTAPAEEFNQATDNLLQRLREQQEFSGKRLELTQILAPRGIPAKSALVVGLGPRESLDRG